MPTLRTQAFPLHFPFDSLKKLVVFSSTWKMLSETRFCNYK